MTGQQVTPVQPPSHAYHLDDDHEHHTLVDRTTGRTWCYPTADLVERAGRNLRSVGNRTERVTCPEAGTT